ncbi:MAG: ATP-binding cassette domain-containing protein [Ignavibacteriota bacterium]
MLEGLTLYAHRDTPIASYSKGMRQRIVLISALMHDPELLVLDEPFSGLDVTSALVVRRVVGMLAAQGKAVFFRRLCWSRWKSYAAIWCCSRRDRWWHRGLSKRYATGSKGSAWKPDSCNLRSKWMPTGWRKILSRLWWSDERPFARLVRHFLVRLVRDERDASSNEVQLGVGALLGLLSVPGAMSCFILLDKYSSFSRGCGTV